MEFPVLFISQPLHPDLPHLAQQHQNHQLPDQQHQNHQLLQLQLQVRKNVNLVVFCGQSYYYVAFFQGLLSVYQLKYLWKYHRNVSCVILRFTYP